MKTAPAKSISKDSRLWVAAADPGGGPASLIPQFHLATPLPFAGPLPCDIPFHGNRPVPPLFVRRQSGVALLITLLMLSLITIIVVAFLGTMTWEASASRNNYENQKARSLAMLGMNTAVGQLRNALGLWDNPFVNFTNAPATNYYWSVSPGILTRWSYTNAAPLTNYPLFSLDPNGATNLVNLNAAAGDGTYPIAGGPTPPAISVYWANVLKNPANATASATNPIIGRYAFWIDDENAKINLNTADGTLKYTTNSLGLGTPSEVSLQVLQQGGADLSTQMATNIVSLARTTGFNSVREILRAPGATYDLYTNNVFNLTTYGRTPEINLFGEPKINFIPASIPSSESLQPGYLQTNDITLRPLTEIYPTPYQLPPYLNSNACAGTPPPASSNPMQPEVMSQEWPIFVGTAGNVAGHYFLNLQGYDGDRQGYMIDLISRYLGGTNRMNKAVQWPVFPYPSTPLAGATSSGAKGFVGKYSLRQLDALATQITDLGDKAITPEAVNEDEASSFTGYTLSNPSTHGGLLSHQLVPGLGRVPRINEISILVTVSGGNISSAPELPFMTMALYVETYFPAGFAGVDLLNINNGLPPAATMQNAFEMGGGPDVYGGSLNLEDMPSSSGGNFPRPVNATNIASIPRLPPQPFTTSPTNQPNDYWGDTLLQNNAGIDFVGNQSDSPDPDQTRAAFYHLGFPTNSSGQYLGAGGSSINPEPLLRMGYLSQKSLGTAPGTIPWYPGQYRTVVNDNPTTAYGMMTNAAAAVTNLTFSGGLIINGYTRGVATADPFKTPFESSVRGSPATASVDDVNSWDGESVTSSSLAWANANPNEMPATPGNEAQTTYSTTELLRDRVMKGMIPVNFSVPIPVPTTSGSSSPVQGWYHAEVADPLVNEFAGDWITNGTSANTMGVGNGSPPAVSATIAGGYSAYYNGQNVSATMATANSPYYDPDSFWMPTLDPKIPRSARMPNIGYLNYQRTGVIPDDETVAVNLQHGTPYRCLDFNAVNDASQMGAVTSYRSSGYYYPDWALLDLFTIPSTLLPYHGAYGYYETNGVWQPGSIMTGNPTNMYNYGTWGGSTPGRINPNGSVVYTTNMNIPTPGITRTVPLQALLHNLKINQTLTSGLSAATATPNALTQANYTGGTTVDDSGTAQAIATYIGTYGPLREPAEICNIPAVSANFPNDTTHFNPTRNDLVRQIVGNLTTQSNTFSVWVAGESIAKSKANTNYGIYESGDQITASVRYHFIVERYLDPGADGTIGNATLPAGSAPTGDLDRIVGTYDDPMNVTYHPPNPRYLYRVVYTEEIRN